MVSLIVPLARRLPFILALVGVAGCMVDDSLDADRDESFDEQGAVPSDESPPSKEGSANTKGNCTGPLCGYIENWYGSDERVRITTDWGHYLEEYTWRTLWPGQGSSGIGVKDADGYFVWSGCRAFVPGTTIYGPQWIKVYDHQAIVINMDCYDW